MKTTRKLFAILLAVAMVMAMAVTAGAATVTIENGQANATYKFYKMMEYDAENDWYKVTNNSWKTVLSKYFTMDAAGYITGKTDEGATKSETELAAALMAEIPTDATAIEVTLDADGNYNKPDIGVGYYLMTSTVNNGEKASLALVTGDVTIREKNTDEGLPTITKTITDAEGKVYNVGDTVNFKIEIECEEGAISYTVHDLMQGMTLNKESVNVSIDNTDVIVTANTTDPTCSDDCTFEIALSFTGAVEAYDKVTITYSATVTEDSVDGMSNKAWIDGVTSEIKDEKKSVTLTKTDSETSAKIDGAEFELYVDENGTKVQIPVVYVEDATNGNYYRPASSTEITNGSTTTITAGTATIKGLEKDKTYYVKETKAPIGYVATADEYITVTATTMNVENDPIDKMPETGGMGTTLFYTVGGIMVVAALVLLVTKKRMAF